MKTKIIIYLILLISLAHRVMAQQQIGRKELLSEVITKRSLSKVDVTEITMPAGQKAPLHKHPCPVFGYVSEGTLLFQIEGHEPRILKAGEAFYEPSDMAISHFDNASTDHIMKFIALYLNNGEDKLIEMLPENSSKL